MLSVWKGASRPNAPCRTICWAPIWNKGREGVGREHLLLAERATDVRQTLMKEPSSLRGITDLCSV
jgi:hypothetical protein